MQTNLVDTQYMQYIEQKCDRELEAWKAVEAQNRLKAPLPEDLEHPEKLKAETAACIDEFLLCLGNDLAFQATLKPGQISYKEAPLLIAVGEAAGRLADLFRRLVLAGLDTDELWNKYTQGMDAVSLAFEGVQAGMD